LTSQAPPFRIRLTASSPRIQLAKIATEAGLTPARFALLGSCVPAIAITTTTITVAASITSVSDPTK